jgi:uncharacterized membrane protein
MSQLIAVAFDDPHKAEEARIDLLKLGHEDLVDLEEAVVVVVDNEGQVRFHHSHHLTLPVALSGGFLGTLAGLIILNPALALIGGITGTAVGAIAGALRDVGIQEDFMKALSENLQPGSSALFVMIRKGKLEKVNEELKKYGGEILQTTLAHQNEAKLREALKKVNES